jgi:hypothetical protein
MTVDQLIAALEQYKGSGLEVRIATQPSYPFEHSIANITTNGEAGLDLEEDEEEILYIAAGIQLDYSSKKLWGDNW